MRFSSVILALVYPVKPELVSPVDPDKIDGSVQSFSTTIYSDYGASG